jgi:hypothetical protein
MRCDNTVCVCHVEAVSSGVAVSEISIKELEKVFSNLFTSCQGCEGSKKSFPTLTLKCVLHILFEEIVKAIKLTVRLGSVVNLSSCNTECNTRPILPDQWHASCAP